MACSAIPTWTNSNIQAGVDTTSILESVILYYLLKNPATLATLREEVDDAAKAGLLTTSSSPSESKILSWKESQSLPYLEACVNEASRLHPPISFPIERIVPAGPGLEVDGHIIPAGTRVSMVCNFDCTTFRRPIVDFEISSSSGSLLSIFQFTSLISKIECVGVAPSGRGFW